MDAIVSFIQSNPGISFLNLQLFFGAEIKGSGFTEDQINAACIAAHPDETVTLGQPDVDDYVVNIPLSVFDKNITDFTVKDVQEICDKIALLKTPIQIVLNEQTPNHREFIDVPLEEFKIPVLTTAYDFIKDKKDPVSKVREMLQDFQPMFLERKSHSILNQIMIDGVPVFNSISDFIKVFTDPTFFGLYQKIGEKPELIQIHARGDVWVGRFGAITVTIHVMEGRQGTAAGGRINAGNVIQAALLYKDRKNDFIRSNSAMSMIKYCPTQWPHGRSLKEGTTYTFSDLYTGEKIVQKYDGKQPDFATDQPFVSILENYHVPQPGKPIYTNQEHLIAVYPASCIFRDDCYYETLVQNLIMISQKANSDVNSKEYESPLGKLQYVHDIHEKHKQDLVGSFYFTKMDLCTRAMSLTDGDELSVSFDSLSRQISEKEIELTLQEYQIAQELNNVHILLGIPKYKIPEAPAGAKKIPVASGKTPIDTEQKELLTKKTDLTSAIASIQINLMKLDDAKKLTPHKPSGDYVSAKKMFVDFDQETEYHTRKALLMGRLSQLQDCCLQFPKDEKTALHRRAIVLSCIDSVEIIIESAKISQLTVTTSATEHQKLVKNSKELEYLRTLSLSLFHTYNSYAEKQTAATSTIIRMIHLQGKLMEKLQKQIIASALTKNELNLSQATLQRHEIDLTISKRTTELLRSGDLNQQQISDAEFALKNEYAEEINHWDEEIIRLKDLKNNLNGEFAYVLNHLSEIGEELSLELFEIANAVNEGSLQLLNLLGTDKTPEFQECMRLLTRPESSYAPVTTGMVEMQDREDVFDDVGIRRTVGLVSEFCPQEDGTDVAIANEIASDILNGEPAADTVDEAIDEKWLLLKQRVNEKLNKKKRLGIDAKQMLAGLHIEDNERKMVYRSALLKRKVVVEGEASSTPSFLRWMGRLNENEVRKKKSRVQRQVDESEGVRSFLYFYFCNNPQQKPKEATVSQIVAHLNANRGEFQSDLERLQLDLETLPSYAKRTVSASAPKRGGMVGGQLEPDEIESQMNDAIEADDVVKMYDLYIDYFDKETDLILFYQVYSILSKKSIYVPLYRCDVPPLEQLIEPVRLKRLDYTGDLHDFDCVYADNFCVQIFGKNVNELLHDLSRGKLTVPRGVFPNICENPFDPYSLICILEVCRFFCLFLPFAGRLHFYFAGMLSFMNQTYSENMVSIQAEQILSYMDHPDFFQCFHAAARMYNERLSETETPLPEPPLPEPPLTEPPTQVNVPAGLKIDPISVSSPPGTTPPGTPGGGTRRYRRYKSKTKRQTLNKRFKKNRTRRLHGLHVRY